MLQIKEIEVMKIFIAESRKLKPKEHSFLRKKCEKAIAEKLGVEHLADDLKKKFDSSFKKFQSLKNKKGNKPGGLERILPSASSTVVFSVEEEPEEWNDDEDGD